jgi:Flp pilus assembly secretin CpaC
MNQRFTMDLSIKRSFSRCHVRWTLFLLVLCASLFEMGARGQDLSVSKGYSAKVAVPDGIRKITVGSDKILDVKSQEDGHVALLTGLAEGSSDLRIERLQGADLIYKVSVRPELQGIMEQMKDMLYDVQGLIIRIVGSKIVFDGKIGLSSDLDKIKKVEAAYPGSVIDLATFDAPEMAEGMKASILKDFHDIGVDSVSVQVTSDTIILDGVVNSDADATRCLEKAKLRMANVKNLLRVQQSMIETDLQFVEVDRDRGSSFGQNLFDNSITLNPTASVGVTGVRPGLGLVAAATYKVNTALTTANCKSIYQEHISGASGQEVAFKQGNTLYVPGIPAVPYGVIIKVKPTLQGKDGILSDIAVEISTAAWVGGQVTTREFKTSASVMAKIGETVVLSGFAQALGTDSTDKTPGMGDIPLLNLLFSGKSKSKSHKEAVLLLTLRPSSTEITTGPAFSAQAQNVLHDAE